MFRSFTLASSLVLLAPQASRHKAQRRALLRVLPPLLGTSHDAPALDDASLIRAIQAAAVSGDAAGGAASESDS